MRRPHKIRVSLSDAAMAAIFDESVKRAVPTGAIAGRALDQAIVSGMLSHLLDNAERTHLTNQMGPRP